MTVEPRCREKRRRLGLPYPRSSCDKCGTLIRPNFRCVEEAAMDEPEARKPKLCIDFDGVIHSYERGWEGGVIYGNVVPGFFDWAAEAQGLFELCIYSSRSSSESGRLEMGAWLAERLRERGGPPIRFTMCAEKPPAFLTIDDRALTFKGDWAHPDFAPEALAAFKPWNAP